MADAAVVIGVGNAERSDDGAGLEVVARLVGRVPAGVRLVRLGGADAAAIMEAWADATRAVLVDAMASGRPAGTVDRFDAGASPLPAGVRLASTHAMGAAEALELGRALGRLPGAVTVYGIEGATFSPGRSLSPAVLAAVEEAAGLIAEEVSGA